MSSADGERVLLAIDRLDDRLREMQTQMAERFDALADRFVPRVELMNRFDAMHEERVQLRLRLENGEVKHDGDVKTLAKQIEAVDRRRITDRRYILTTSIAGLILAVGVLSLLLSHLH